MSSEPSIDVRTNAATGKVLLDVMAIGQTAVGTTLALEPHAAVRLGERLIAEGRKPRPAPKERG
ncbi:MAG: hypothetical protein IKE60_34395 [Reyranella sp.]|uniref:hypothetical protein n=1 Tax=Reyranella sp. TaxID=1929291 RepID=UPI0025D35A2F|nr:hypothetical protein [Reyranella sp.]MBR2819811.1 hypothetical protein [Reyranella sp.]